MMDSSADVDSLSEIDLGRVLLSTGRNSKVVGRLSSLLDGYHKDLLNRRRRDGAGQRLTEGIASLIQKYGVEDICDATTFILAWKRMDMILLRTTMEAQLGRLQQR